MKTDLPNVMIERKNQIAGRVCRREILWMIKICLSVRAQISEFEREKKGKEIKKGIKKKTSSYIKKRKVNHMHCRT
jgi:DNA invertase Pin-like site-specific DNA recombinase